MVLNIIEYYINIEDKKLLMNIYKNIHYVIIFNNKFPQYQ